MMVRMIYWHVVVDAENDAEKHLRNAENDGEFLLEWICEHDLIHWQLPDLSARESSISAQESSFHSSLQTKYDIIFHFMEQTVRKSIQVVQLKANANANASQGDLDEHRAKDPEVLLMLIYFIYCILVVII